MYENVKFGIVRKQVYHPMIRSILSCINSYEVYSIQANLSKTNHYGILYMISYHLTIDQDFWNGRIMGTAKKLKSKELLSSIAMKTIEQTDRYADTQMDFLSDEHVWKTYK